jgi:hypothetical protein
MAAVTRESVPEDALLRTFRAGRIRDRRGHVAQGHPSAIRLGRGGQARRKQRWRAAPILIQLLSFHRLYSGALLRAAKANL